MTHTVPTHALHMHAYMHLCNPKGARAPLAVLPTQIGCMLLRTCTRMSSWK